MNTTVSRPVRSGLMPGLHPDLVCAIGAIRGGRFLYSAGRSAATGWVVRVAVVSGARTGSGRELAVWPGRSSNLPKIILPAVVCSTEVTEMYTVLPIILRALSTTTIVP